MYSYSYLDAQSEIARRREFVSEGMQVAQWLGSFVFNCLRPSRGRLLEVVSDRRASLRRRVFAEKQLERVAGTNQTLSGVIGSVSRPLGALLLALWSIGSVL